MSRQGFASESGTALVGDPGAVGRDRRALDVLVQDPRGAPAHGSLDQVGLAAGRQRGVERVAVAGREGHAPEVHVDRGDQPLAAHDLEVLEVGELRAAADVDERRLRREGAGGRVRVAGDEHRDGAVAPVGRHARTARHAVDVDPRARLELAVEEPHLVALGEAAAAREADAVPGGEVAAIAAHRLERPRRRLGGGADGHLPVALGPAGLQGPEHHDGLAARGGVGERLAARRCSPPRSRRSWPSRRRRRRRPPRCRAPRGR